MRGGRLVCVIGGTAASKLLVRLAAADGADDLRAQLALAKASGHYKARHRTLSRDRRVWSGSGDDDPVSVGVCELQDALAAAARRPVGVEAGRGQS